MTDTTPSTEVVDEKIAKVRRARPTAQKATKVAAMSNGTPAKALKIAKVTEIRMCICHCGEATTNNFRQGHDARAKGQLIRHLAEKGTLAGFPNDELVAYAKAGGFTGRFSEADFAKARAPRKTKVAAA